jgi:predicted transcriptional regulator
MATSPTRTTRQDGAEIERRRTEAGISVSGLAQTTGLHKTYIRYIERETRSAQPDTLKLIADALPECEVKDLLKGATTAKRQAALPGLRRAG